MRPLFYAVVIAGLLGNQASRADETVKWLHVEVNPQQIAIW